MAIQLYSQHRLAVPTHHQLAPLLSYLMVLMQLQHWIELRNYQWDLLVNFFRK